MANNVNTTEAEVLSALLSRLRSALGLNESRCFAALDGESPPSIPPGGDFFLVVSPGNGDFHVNEQFVGNVMVSQTFRVSIFVRIALDQTGREELLLLNTDRGVTSVKRRVLIALVGHELLNESGSALLNQYLYVIQSSPPRLSEWSNGGRTIVLAQFTMDIGADYQWDIVE